jgi:hypothetical protein
MLAINASIISTNCSVRRAMKGALLFSFRAVQQNLKEMMIRCVPDRSNSASGGCMQRRERGSVLGVVLERNELVF